MMNYIALIPAAGVGSRFGASYPKKYVELAGQAVLQHTIDLFVKNGRLAHIAVIVSPDDEWVDEVIRLPENVAVYRAGGKSRAETVVNGLNYLINHKIIQADDMILVHDAVRCCLPQTALNRLLDTVGNRAQGGILAIPVVDTLKRAEHREPVIAKTVSRAGLWQAQTPQMFQAALLQKSLQNVDFSEITDEASAVERLGIAPLLVEGDSRNIKLTRADDADYVAWLLGQ